MLPLGSLSSLSRSLHLLHHQVLLLKRGLLSLHSRLMLLQHGVALLLQGCSHSLDRPYQVLPVALWGWRRSYTRGCHNTGHKDKTIRNLVRLETHLNTTKRHNES